MESGTYFKALLSKNCTISYLGELVTISSMISSPSSYPLSTQILELFKHSKWIWYHSISSLIWYTVLLICGGFTWWSAERWWVSVVEKGGSTHVQKQKMSAVIGLTHFFRLPISCLSLKHQYCALYHVCNHNGIRYPAKSKPMLCCCVCFYQTAMVFYDHIQYFLLITISLEDHFSSVTCTSAIFWL